MHNYKHTLYLIHNFKNLSFSQIQTYNTLFANPLFQKSTPK